MKTPFEVLLILAVVLFVGTSADRLVANDPNNWTAEDATNLNRQVRSILSNKCFACHGPDEEAVESGLRLDTFDGATESAIVPGEPNESDLMERIASEDPDFVMPPPSHGKPLTKEEQNAVKRWIESGAKYDRHWSYEKPVRPEVPQTDSDWPANAIDKFALQKMKAQKMTPSKEADRYALIRRVALDLTGLPPTIAEADAFVADTSADAYEKMVDDYLKRPAAGERWASMWLDLARYADSAGYADDRKRTIWAYRDYVIRAYNANMPFDQFTREQIAGDLLPNPSDEQLIATAFHRNTLTNSEGGTSDEEFRSAAIVDRVNTTMAVWMGTTMACAQCHTHKYDPITHKEYFQFYAFFNQSADNDRSNEKPLLDIYSTETRQKRDSLANQIAALKSKGPDPVTAQGQAEWEATLKANGATTQGRYVRVDLPGKQKILSLAEVQVFNADENVAINGTATQSSTDYGGPPQYANDGKTDGDFEKKSVTHTELENNPWWQVDLKRTTPIDKIVIWNRLGGNLAARLNGFRISILDEKKNTIWTKEITKAPKVSQEFQTAETPDSIRKILGKKDRTDEQAKTLAGFYQQSLETQHQTKIDLLTAEMNALRPMTTVPVMKQIDEKNRRETNIQIRGNYADKGELVDVATPATFHPLESESSTQSRLDLANWLVDSNNPLTARVVANRYWEQFFGTGLVRTSEEFGAQGDLPTHPMLLDYLACELIENGWDTQALIKSIVMSSTYRQSSRATLEQLELDPANRWLARGPRVRLTAEMIRDQALEAGGLLSSKMFGPPVQPPQPKVGLKPAFSGQSTNWKDSTGEDRYRRGIYTEWRRSAPYASMSTFDVNSREVCEVRRSRTNTPLQALVTLNDPVYVEAAQGLAKRILQFGGAKQDGSDQSSNGNKSVEEMVEHGFRLCLVRPPTATESETLTRLLKASQEHFASDTQAAASLASGPPANPSRPLLGKFSDADMAAWTTVANVILNLDEVFMKR